MVRKLFAGVVLLFIVAACGPRLAARHVAVQASPGVSVSPDFSPLAAPPPAASPSPSVSTSHAPLPSPSPRHITTAAAPIPSPTPVAMLCRMPVDVNGVGAWVDIPAQPPVNGYDPNMQVSDPAGNVRLPDGEAPTGVTFNWTLKRWLPVPRQLVAPDGFHYTYEDSAHSLHLVDGATGTDAVLTAGGGGIPIGVDANYVYVVTPNGSVPAGRNGLTEVPTSGAAAIPITSSGSWYMVSGGEVWGLDQQGKTFPGFTDQIAGHVLDRLDLASKAATAWLTSTDAYYVITDVTTSGEPILLGGTNQYYADTEYLVTSQGQAPVIGGEIDIWDGEIDKYGTWLVGTESAAIWYGAGSSSPTLWAKYANTPPRFAGPCGPMS